MYYKLQLNIYNLDSNLMPTQLKILISVYLGGTCNTLRQQYN